MNLKHLGIATIALGFVLLAMSFVWTSIVPQEVIWTAEQASKYQEVSQRLHSESFDRNLPPQKLAQSELEYEQLQKQLDRAIALKTSTPFYLRMAGITVGALGIGLILVERSQDT